MRLLHMALAAGHLCSAGMAAFRQIGCLRFLFP
jgi:hypothetical protein